MHFFFCKTKFAVRILMKFKNKEMLHTQYTFIVVLILETTKQEKNECLLLKTLSLHILLKAKVLGVRAPYLFRIIIYLHDINFLICINIYIIKIIQ